MTGSAYSPQSRLQNIFAAILSIAIWSSALSRNSLDDFGTVRSMFKQFRAQLTSELVDNMMKDDSYCSLVALSEVRWLTTI